MFINFTSCDDQVLKQHYKEMAAAAREGVARLPTTGQPAVLDRATGGFGAGLVRLGQRLQRHIVEDKRRKASSLKRA